MRLLAAEDDPKLLKSLVHIFEHSKFSVDGVTNGGDALTYARSMGYDGLVLDIMMPGLDGIQVLQTLRREGITTPALFLTLNRSTYQLSCGDRVQALSGREFQILEMLMQAPGTILSAERFITHLWGWDTTVDTSVVWVHISNLRKKINAVGAPLDIRFVRGVGYTLEVRA